MLSAALLTLWLAAGGTGCYESLPPVVVPPEVLRPGGGFNTAADMLVKVGDRLVPEGSVGALNVTVQNLHDEYLMDSVRIEVKATLTFPQFPGEKVVVTMNEDDLITSGIVAHGMLTIAPRQEVKLQKQWSHIALGKPIISYARQEDWVTVRAVNGKLMPAFPVRVLMNVSVKVFSIRPTQYVPSAGGTSEFVLNYTYGAM